MVNITGKTILIAGGTSSLGNALIDYLKNDNVQFIIYSRDEKKQHDLYILRENNNISYIVGDIKGKGKLIQSLKSVDYVFHTTLKHVPTGENFPEEAIQTNVIGTKNVIEAPEYCGVKKVIAISTDKAVQPVNAYGMSKALAEKIISAHKGQTVVVCLRYGNVLGSRGSVVPLFLDFIHQGKPITVTNPNMTRFLLTLNEAVKLALRCLNDGDRGDLFVIKSPACTIGTLIDALELHFGKKFTRILLAYDPVRKFMKRYLLAMKTIGQLSNMMAASYL